MLPAIRLTSDYDSVTLLALPAGLLYVVGLKILFWGSICIDLMELAGDQTGTRSSQIFPQMIGI